MRPSPNSAISPSVDYDRDGVRYGFLKLPYSRDDSAWGEVMIPSDGILAGRHFPDLAQSGDCLAVVAVPQA